MTNQEAFDAVYRHFIINDAPYSVDIENECMYRGPGGEKCAGGLLIPDFMYKSSMEGKKIGALLGDVIVSGGKVAYDYPELVEYFSGTDIGLLKLLQRSHDATSYTRDKKQMTEQLKLIAKEYNLTIPEA